MENMFVFLTFSYLCIIFQKNMQETKPITKYRLALREKILTTAMTAFAKNGIKAVKMDDIAQSLSISKRTLYEIYDNKELLLYEGIKRYEQEREAEMKRLQSNKANVMDMLLQSYKVKIEEFRMTHPTFYTDLVLYPKVQAFLENNKDKYHERFMHFLKQGVREGFFRQDVDYELVTIMLDAIGQRIMNDQLYRQYTIEHIFKNMVFVTLRGFCTPKGTRAIDGIL